jgi:hypothetical protein
MVLPTKSNASVLRTDLQPARAADHATVDTHKWLDYTGQTLV